jgi:hypothetical protein
LLPLEKRPFTETSFSRKASLPPTNNAACFKHIHHAFYAMSCIFPEACIFDQSLVSHHVILQCKCNKYVNLTFAAFCLELFLKPSGKNTSTSLQKREGISQGCCFYWITYITTLINFTIQAVKWYPSYVLERFEEHELSSLFQQIRFTLLVTTLDAWYYSKLLKVNIWIPNACSARN